MKAEAWMVTSTGNPNVTYYSRDDAEYQRDSLRRTFGENITATITPLCAVDPGLVDALLELFDAAQSCYGPGHLVGTAHATCVRLVAAHRDAATGGE